MKNLVKIILLFFLSLSFAPLLSTNQVSANINDFSFVSFYADYYLSKDSEGHSTMKVVERLTADFKNYNQNHGIERAIPLYYDGHSVSFNFESMQRNGVTEPLYEQRREPEFMVLSTRRDEFVNGIQEYTFTYTLKDVTKDFGDHQELYWDVNGTGWGQSFGSLRATVHLDASVAKDFTGDVSCYKGLEKSNARCDYSLENDTVSLASKGTLRAHENVTFDLSFKANSFVGYRMTLADYFPFVLMTIAGMLLLVAIFIKFRYGRDFPGRGTIAPEYTPPKNISVLQAAEISGGSAAITAQLLDFAVRKKIRIIEAEKKTLGIFESKEYTIELLSIDGLDEDELGLITIFFNDLAISSTYIMKNSDNSIPMKVSSLLSSIRKKSKDMGYRKRQIRRIIIQSLVLIGALGFAMLSSIISRGNGVAPLFGVFVMLMIIVSVIIFKLLELSPLTKTGRELYDYLKGLELYIKMAEADRIRFLQTPDGAQRQKIDTNDPRQIVILYERLLPYAVLFKQEKEWLKQLGDYYENSSASPGWYSGTSGFNSVTFASSVSSFSSYSNSSSSSGNSGAGGGGSSGGGGGGGGGGGC